VVEAKRPELRIAAALCLGTATQKVLDQVLQPGSTGVELFAAVPDQAAAVRTGDPLAPVARLSVGNLVITLDLSLITSGVRVLRDDGVRSPGSVAPAAACEGEQVVILGFDSVTARFRHAPDSPYLLPRHAPFDDFE
jgi:hypothetical protein